MIIWRKRRLDRQLAEHIREAHALYHDVKNTSAVPARFLEIRRAIPELQRLERKIMAKRQRLIDRAETSLKILYRLGGVAAGAVAGFLLGPAAVTGFAVAVCASAGWIAGGVIFGARTIPVRQQATIDRIFMKPVGTCRYRLGLLREMEHKILRENMKDLAVSPALVSALDIWKNDDLISIFARAGVKQMLKDAYDPDWTIARDKQPPVPPPDQTSP